MSCTAGIMNGRIIAGGKKDQTKAVPLGARPAAGFSGRDSNAGKGRRQQETGVTKSETPRAESAGAEQGG